MSKRDGKMYIAWRLVGKGTTNLGLPIRVENDKCAGCLFVFWTKTAAREVYGRNVELSEIRVSTDE